MAGTARQAKGKANKVAGSAKKAVGKATKNRSLQAKGSAQKAKGTVQDVAGKVERKVRGTLPARSSGRFVARASEDEGRRHVRSFRDARGEGRRQH